MTEKTVVLLGCLLVLGFALAAAAIHVPRFEAGLGAEVSAALEAEGLAIEPRVAGREVELHGRLPAAEARHRAVKAVAALPGVRRVVDELETAPSAHLVAPGAVAAPSTGSGANTPPPAALDGHQTAAAPPDRQAEFDDLVAGRRIDFRKYSEELTPAAAMVVSDVAAYLVSAPQVAVEIAGYTDSRGDLEGNYEISRRRAEAVRRALIEKGVVGSRLTAVGRGPDDPVADNATAAGRRANRRVELSVVKAAG